MSMGLYDAAFATVGGLLGKEAGPSITGITLVAGFGQQRVLDPRRHADRPAGLARPAARLRRADAAGEPADGLAAGAPCPAPPAPGRGQRQPPEVSRPTPFAGPARRVLRAALVHHLGHRGARAGPAARGRPDRGRGRRGRRPDRSRPGRRPHPGVCHRPPRRPADQGEDRRSAVSRRRRPAAVRGPLRRHPPSHCATA